MYIAIRLIFLAYGLAISSWAPIIPLTKIRLDLNDAQLGLLLLVLGVGALLIMPVTGWLNHKYGSRTIVLVSCLSIIPLMPLLVVADSTFTLSTILLLFGVATGAMNVSMNAQAVEISTTTSTSILSGVHCWFSIGGLLGASLVSALLEFSCPLVLCMSIVALLVFVLLITQWQNLIVIADSNQLDNSVKITFPNYRGNCKTRAGCFSALLPIFGLWRNPPTLKSMWIYAKRQISAKIARKPAKREFCNSLYQLLFLGSLCFIAFMVEGAMLDWSAEYLRSILHYDPSMAGLGYALFSIAMASGRFFGDRLINHFGTLRVYQMGSVLSASGLLIIVNFSLGYAELLGFALIGLGASNIVPILFGNTGKIPQVSSNYALTIVTTFGYLGLLFGPALIGFVAQATTLSFAFVGLALLMVSIGYCGRFAFPQYDHYLLDS